MQLTSLFAAVASTFVAVVSGAIVVPRAATDVYVPRITSPTNATVWTMGQVETVTWDASNAPANISNAASVFLEDYGTLVSGFDLKTGSVNVTVPFLFASIRNPNQVQRIILYGDSGNESPDFKIVIPPPVPAPTSTASIPASSIPASSTPAPSSAQASSSAPAASSTGA